MLKSRREHSFAPGKFTGAVKSSAETFKKQEVVTAPHTPTKAIRASEGHNLSNQKTASYKLLIQSFVSKECFTDFI